MPFKKPFQQCVFLTLLCGFHPGAWAVPAPANMVCEGWEADTVRIFWTRGGVGATEWRVQRSIDGAPWEQIAVQDSLGYIDTGIDTAANNRYRIEAYSADDDSTALGDVCNNRRIYETEHFRIFYGVRDTSDDCPRYEDKDMCLADINDGVVNVYAKLAGDVLEGSVSAFDRVGFPEGKSTQPPDGLDRIPVNIRWSDGGGSAGQRNMRLSPELLETAFDTTTRVGDPVAYMVSVHEMFHILQLAYPGLSISREAYVYEGQARSIQDKLCLGADRASCDDFDDVEGGRSGYVPQIANYMENTALSITDSSYDAVLFWTYLTEKFGTIPAGDSVEGGMNLMVQFWEALESGSAYDGITAIDAALEALGHSERFEDVWKDFAVANYAKNLSGAVPAVYQYSDMAEPGGNYPAVSFVLDEELSSSDQWVGDSSLSGWGADYFRVRPDASVENVTIDFGSRELYYTVFGLRDGELEFEENVQSAGLEYLLPNDGYDEVVIVVAGLGDNFASYRYSISGADTTLEILRPTLGNKARVGDPSMPEKFLVAVELLDSEGELLSDVNIDNFNFTVGSELVPPENVVSAARLQGQYWFTLRAPVQAAAGSYDLRVAYGDVPLDTQSNAVFYAPREDTDAVLAVDKSGSMAAFGKLDNAKDAAKLFIDSWREGDQVALVSFNAGVTLDLNLTPWSDAPAGGSRGDLFELLEDLEPGGATALGDAAFISRNELNARGDIDHDWGIVLLSDGLQTDGFRTLEGVSTDIANAGVNTKTPALHAIALGPDADQQGMQAAAERTGGSYQYVAEPAGGTALATGAPSLVNVSSAILADASLQLELDKRYRVISSRLDGTQQVFSLQGPQNDGDPDSEEIIFPVEPNATEMIVSLSFEGINPGGDIALYDANGILVPLFKSTGRHYVWRADNPVGGDWRLSMEQFILIQNWPDIWMRQLQGLFASPAYAQTADYFPPYLVQVSLASEITMQTLLPLAPEERISGRAMPILVSLTENAPITGATVSASIANPQGILGGLVLFDDGAHGDGAADDGIYGNTFTNTQQEGSYGISISASGTSPINGSFQRQDALSFFIFGGGDPDGDGLPLAWEMAFGTDIDQDDADEDPDSDGLTNRGEWERGTDPFNPDTDNGGEADGTDDNPLDPSDDRIAPSQVSVYADNEKVNVIFLQRPSYVRIDILRAIGPDGTYETLANVFDGQEIYVDETVTNGAEFCYMVIAYDADGRRAPPSNFACGIPRVDAFAPHGTVLINAGQPFTVQPEVNLTLWASDLVDPEFISPGKEKRLSPELPNSGVSEMMLSNSADFLGASWEPYKTSKRWTLDSSGDTPMVYVKYRDPYLNESEVAFASIALKTLELAACSGDPLGAANDFDYFVLGNATQSASIVGGRIAVGANAELQDVYLGATLKHTGVSDALVVRSDIDFARGKVFYGDVVYGGSGNVRAKVRRGEIQQGTPIGFGSEALGLATNSTAWSSLAANGSASMLTHGKTRFGYRGKGLAELRLEGNHPQLNVIDVSAEQLENARKIVVHAPAGSSVLINVSGAEVSVRDTVMLAFGGVSQKDIIFNFFQADSASIKRSGLLGTLLMPLASLELEYSILRGSAITETLTGKKNYVSPAPFGGCLPLPSS